MTRTSENVDVVEELVSSQKDAPAPEIHSIARHFEHKNRCYCESDFPMLEISVLYQFKLIIFQKPCCEFC